MGTRKILFGIAAIVASLLFLAWGSEPLFSTAQSGRQGSGRSVIPQVGRFRIVAVSAFPEENSGENTSLLLDTATGCVWRRTRVDIPTGGGKSAVVGYQFESIPVGQDPKSRPFELKGNMSVDEHMAALMAAYLDNQKMQSKDCDSARFSALDSGER